MAEMNESFEHDIETGKLEPKIEDSEPFTDTRKVMYKLLYIVLVYAL